MKQLLVIEDGHEYEQFASLFLGNSFSVYAAHSSAEALRMLAQVDVDGFLLDLRFDRSERNELTGDIEEIARRLFAGDTAAAENYVREHQGTLILAQLRQAGHSQIAVFVHDFAQRRLENLRRMYGRVQTVPSFDAEAIEQALRCAE